MFKIELICKIDRKTVTSIKLQNETDVEKVPILKFILQILPYCKLNNVKIFHF